jgi:hypothetical protein
MKANIAAGFFVFGQDALTKVCASGNVQSNSINSKVFGLKFDI